MTTTDERPGTTPLYDALRSNVAYIVREIAEGRDTGLRFLRFRPQRELEDTLSVAEQIARERVARDPEVVDVEAAVGGDWAVSVLRDALKIQAPANQVAACPAGYRQPPYPLNAEDRELLYASTSRILTEQMPRLLPGGADGWSWRVEPQVASDQSALLIRLTPRNERFEDPIVHVQTPEEQDQAAEPDGPGDGRATTDVKPTDAPPATT